MSDDSLVKLEESWSTVSNAEQTIYGKRRDFASAAETIQAEKQMAESERQEKPKMKRGILYLAVLSIMLLSPMERTDLGKLKPVETVLIYEDRGRVVLETDTEDRGSGATVELALRDMKENSSGVIYMDTADYLLLGEGAESWVPELRGLLKGKVQVCMAEKEVDIRLAGSFLAVHKPKWTIDTWTLGVKQQKLTVRDGKMKLK